MVGEKEKDIFNQDTLLVMAVRTLENQFGEEIVDRIVEWKHDQTKENWEEISESEGRTDPEYLFRLFDDNVHDYDVIEKNRDRLEVKVESCKHAEIFKKFNAADVGKKMSCAGDQAVVEGFNPEINFERPEVLMDGDDSCHFIFELQKE
ncbi:hypothetical protein AKJ57_02510 [candidate division MSBL1 archaeon SCGC-AAA259A05]|uniref:L-2-amino-thiazoline-4-carboxylic acid hydrolase n=1 Tax=candidate division MSBL1 archaeon SCGC-AAA259A05 TaxID=1698259 RepID=A0A133UA71_9EURY|nr:hypothetical protein AKJ57_02510 [candidate division MSBL1 archaeon SCGC-AAA259A05]